MIRLYESTETARSASSLGICGLPDFSKCTVTEERNGEYFLEGEYPTSGIFADRLMVDRFLSAKPNRKDNPQFFRIAKLEPPLNGLIKITAYHHSYDLKKISSTPISATISNAAQWLNVYFTNAKPTTRPSFIFQSDTNEIATRLPAVDRPMSIRQIMAGMDGSVLDIYGGEYYFDGVYVKLLKQRGRDTGKKIIYGSNMVSMNQEISGVDAVYGMIPYFMSSENGCIIGDTIIREAEDDSYTPPFDMVIPVDLTEQWNAINGSGAEPTEAQLNTFAAQRIQTIVQEPAVSMDIGYVELSDSAEYADITSGDIGLCDIVTVIYPESGVNLKSKIVKTVYNVLTGRYDQIVIGTIKKDLIDLLRRIK